MLGIVLGLFAALMQSVSYLCSRHFTHRFNAGSVRLLVLSHLWMGAISSIAAVLYWPDGMPPLGQYIWPLAGTMFFYLLGQIGLFMALKYTEASRISPLLALKVVILALIGTIFLSLNLNLWQWVAVCMALGGAALLNWSGGSLPFKAILWLLFTCLNYSLSDLNILVMIEHMQPLPAMKAALIGNFCSYALGGACMLPLLYFHRKAPKEQWIGAFPFAASWFVAMLFLFTCFAQIGVVYGNIIQSTRGIMSILIGAMLASRGAVHLEAVVARSVFARRLFAALLTLAAIVIYQGMKP